MPSGEGFAFRPGKPTGLRTLDDLRRDAGLLRMSLEEEPIPILRMMDQAFLRMIGRSTGKEKREYAHPFPCRPGPSAPPGASARPARLNLVAHAYDRVKEDNLSRTRKDAALIFIAAVADFYEKGTLAPSPGGVGNLGNTFMSSTGKVRKGVSRTTPFGFVDALLETETFSSRTRQFAKDVRDGLIDFHREEPTFLERMRDALFQSDSTTIKKATHRERKTKATAAEFTHREDFSTIAWKGETYSLGPNQRSVIETLHDAHQKEEPGIRQADIIADIPDDNPPVNLRDCFRGSPLWKKLVVRVSAGVYKLALRKKCTTCTKK